MARIYGGVDGVQFPNVYNNNPKAFSSKTRAASIAPSLSGHGGGKKRLLQADEISSILGAMTKPVILNNCNEPQTLALINEIRANGGKKPASFQAMALS